MNKKLFFTLIGMPLFWGSALAWGGLFNRYNPSLLNNFGYAGVGGVYGGYGKEVYDEENALDQPEFSKYSSQQLMEEVDPCPMKKCTANEHCCKGYVCIDEDQTTGVCMVVWGKKEGERCFRDVDCESGFACTPVGHGSKVCKAPKIGDGKLGEDCRVSSDCNVNRGLCCRLQRRARSQPKKVCTYFTDVDVCIGPVSASDVMTTIEHTAGEKRMSGHPDDFLRLK